MDEQARDEMVERITRVGMMLEDLSAKALGAAELDELGLRELAEKMRRELESTRNRLSGLPLVKPNSQMLAKRTCPKLVQHKSF